MSKKPEDLKPLLAYQDSRNEKTSNGISRYCYRYRPVCREGFTLLHYAMIFGNAEIVKYLLSNGAGTFLFINIPFKVFPYFHRLSGNVKN